MYHKISWRLFSFSLPFFIVGCPWKFYYKLPLLQDGYLNNFYKWRLKDEVLSLCRSQHLHFTKVGITILIQWTENIPETKLAVYEQFLNKNKLINMHTQKNPTRKTHCLLLELLFFKDRIYSTEIPLILQNVRIGFF